MSELAEEKSHSLKVSLQILIQSASDAWEKKKEEMAGYNPAELPRRENCLLGGGAGRSPIDRKGLFYLLTIAFGKWIVKELNHSASSEATIHD